MILIGIGINLLLKELVMGRVRASLTVALIATIGIPFAAVSAQEVGSTTYPAGRTATAKTTKSTAVKSSPQQPTIRSNQRVLTPTGVRTSTYVPRHLRQDQAGAAPSKIQPVPADGSSIGSGAMIIEPEVGMDVGEVIDGDWVEDGAMDCNECGVCETDCCPPRPACWLDGFGGVLYSGEYFIGGQAHTGLSNRGTESQFGDECGFGFYGGANFGVPLNWLTCGFLSGQLGLSSVNSNLGGNPAGDAQHQLFVTGGFYRRVDYGLQGGVVADFMDAEWHFNPQVVQIRGELSWAYPAGHVYGFRFFEGVQDYEDEGSSIFDRATVDNYRFFARSPICAGGYTEFSGGWTQEGQGLFGADFDAPLSSCCALKSGMTYLFTSDGHDNDAWNIYVGISFRPQGKGWWQNYHRPMFDVANNGNLILQ